MPSIQREGGWRPPLCIEEFRRKASKKIFEKNKQFFEKGIDKYLLLWYNIYSREDKEASPYDGKRG